MFPDFIADEINSMIVGLGKSKINCKKCFRLVDAIIEEIDDAQIFVCPICNDAILFYKR